MHLRARFTYLLQSPAQAGSDAWGASVRTMAPTNAKRA